MTAKDIYRIVVKIFGLYLIIAAITYFLPLISYLKYQNQDDILSLTLIIPFVIVVLIIFAVIFKTDKLIAILKLEKGHSTDKLITNSLTDISIIKLAVILISLYLFVNYLPSFIYQSFAFFKSNRNEYSGFVESLGVAIYFDFYNWAMSLSNITIAYLMFSNFDIISVFLLKRIVEKNDEPLDDFTTE